MHYVLARVVKTDLRTNEPKREKTYLLTCTPNEDSNQPAHPRSLIRVFYVRMEKI